MQQAQFVANPFAMLLDPERVLRAVEGSERLNHLHSRVCRPLDKVAMSPDDSANADFDQLIDESLED